MTASRPNRRPGYDDVAVAIQRNGSGTVNVIAGSVVAVGPERDSRGRVGDRRVVGTRSTLRLTGHNNLTAAVHSNGPGCVSTICRSIVAVGPERDAGVRVGDRYVIRIQSW